MSVMEITVVNRFVITLLEASTVPVELVIPSCLMVSTAVVRI